MKNAGESFNLNKETLLSELSNLNGKYYSDKVLYVNDGSDGDRYAIIALNWQWEENIYPRLAIRWFHGKYGFPHNGQNASWFIIPPSFNDYVLEMLESKKFSPAEIKKIRDFLTNKT